MKYIFFIVIISIFYGCSDVEREPVVTDNVAPGQVTEVVTTSIPGGVNITYQLPTDPDLLYVEASYTLPNGEKMKTNSSSNNRNVKIEGFAEVTEYEATLTCIDRSGNRSNPYIVKFTPDTPPVVSVFNSIEMQPDFGGVNLQWENPTGADLAILIYKTNELGEVENIDTYYTSSKTGYYSVRGLEDVESEFSVKLRDKWNNFSDTKKETLTPLYETQLDPAKLKVLGFEYTSNLQLWDMSFLADMWDNKFENMVTERSQIPWYASITIDDQPIRLSRVVFWQFSWSFNSYGHFYAGNNGRIYELYGSADEIPTTDMSGWELLMTCTIVKPSGLPYIIGRDNMSNEDYDIAKNKGHEFILPLDAPAVRHLRIRCLETFGGTIGSFSELQIFGSPEKKLNQIK